MEDQSTTALIISRLDDIKADVNRNFDLLVSAQKNLHEKFEAHEALDTEQFNALKTTISNAAAANDATASFKAKLWAAIGSGVSLIVGIAGGIVGDYILWGRK